MDGSDRLRLVGCLVDGRYRIDVPAGHGGFGSVYRAYHVRFRGSVAVKFLRVPPGLTSEARDGLLAAFEEEGRVMFELSSLHPAIVQVKESGVLLHDGALLPYLVLEWLDGVPLDREIRARRDQGLRPRSLREAMAVLGPIADALAVTHARGIAHRDVKPGNVFLARVGDSVAPKLLDFGIAKAIDTVGSTTAKFAPTSEHPSSFTALYGAPEQWFVRLGATGPWTDVYGFALVLVEMLAGSTPPHATSAKELAGAALDPEVRPTPRAAGIDVPDDVERVLQRALSVDPRDRHRDLAELWRDLQNSLAVDPLGELSGVSYDQLVVMPASTLGHDRVTGEEAREATCETEPASGSSAALNAELSHPPVSGQISVDRFDDPVEGKTRRARRWKVAAAIGVAALVPIGLGLGSAARPASNPAVTSTPSRAMQETASTASVRDALERETKPDVTPASVELAASFSSPLPPTTSVAQPPKPAPVVVRAARPSPSRAAAPAASSKAGLATQSAKGDEAKPPNTVSPEEALSSWR